MLFVGALVAFLAAASRVGATDENYCQTYVAQKAGSASSQYTPDPSTQGSHASLSLDSSWADGFVHGFGTGRNPDIESIAVTSSAPLPVTSSQIAVELSGSLRRLDKAKTIAPHWFDGAAIIARDGRHVQVLVCLNPADADPGEYRGSIQVYAAKDVDPIAIPVDVSFQPTNPTIFLGLGFLIVLLGLTLKVAGDLEKLSASPSGRIPFRQTLRLYVGDWTRILSLVLSGGVGIYTLVAYYSRSHALIGDFEDLTAMGASILAAEFSVGSVADLIAIFRPPTMQNTTGPTPTPVPAPAPNP